jgi:hypothetical protein
MTRLNLKSNELRVQLESFLMKSSGKDLRIEFAMPWINQIIPGINLLENCDQGKTKHLEGNVAIHTGLVFDSLLEIAKLKLNREANFIERLAVVIHDIKKPQTRKENEDGSVSFPNLKKKLI